MQDPMTQDPTTQNSLSFDNAFQSADPLLYFHHIVDPSEASLHVEVLGANIAYTFHHTKLKSLLSSSEISNRLTAKTVGFLALVTGDGRRIVLAWAESGHGHGLQGDTLDGATGVLPNELWTKRVLNVARQLGVSLQHTYDGKLALVLGRQIPGVYNASHVEMKLAVHAVCVLLNIFNIKHDVNHISRRDMRQLRGVQWADGSTPAFEVYFSRAPCHRCVNVVARLETITGVSIRLLWKQRLVPIVYQKNKAMEDPPPLSRANIPPPAEEQDDDAITLDSLDLAAKDNAKKDNTKRVKIPKVPAARKDITKPLPATPATEAPWWMTGGPPPPETDEDAMDAVPTPPISEFLPTEPLFHTVLTYLNMPPGAKTQQHDKS